MALASEAELVDRHVVPNGGDDVLKHPSSGLVIENVVGHDCRHAHRGCEARQVVEAKLVAGSAA
jgi:hypothetical protein